MGPAWIHDRALGSLRLGGAQEQRDGVGHPKLTHSGAHADCIHGSDPGQHGEHRAILLQPVHQKSVVGGIRGDQQAPSELTGEGGSVERGHAHHAHLQQRECSVLPADTHAYQGDLEDGMGGQAANHTRHGC